MAVPVGVEDGSRVAAEEGNLLGSTPTLLEGDDGKGASAAGFPVDGKVLWVGLWVVSGSSARSRARWRG